MGSHSCLSTSRHLLIQRKRDIIRWASADAPRIVIVWDCLPAPCYWAVLSQMSEQLGDL